MYVESFNGQEFVNFSVQKPMENAIVAGGEKKKSQGQKRRERRKRMKDKLKNEDKEKAKCQEVISQEVTTDAEAYENVFEEDLEIKEINPRSRLRSRKVVLSVGGGEAVASARPSNPNKIIEQVDGVNESDNDDSIEEVEKKDEENIESNLTFDLTISAVAVSFLDAFGSIEENLCRDEDESKVLFISEVHSKAVNDETNDVNTLYTLKIRVVNDKMFLAKLEKKFHNWYPLWHGQPRGTLRKFLKRQ